MSSPKEPKDPKDPNQTENTSRFTADFIGRALVCVALLGLIFVLSAQKFFATRKAANEAQVIAFCHDFYRAQMKFLQSRGRFAANITQLADAGLFTFPVKKIDQLGYYFYIHRDEGECETRDKFCWELQAAPANAGFFGSGTHYFYIDSESPMVYVALVANCNNLARPDYNVASFMTESPVDKCACDDPDNSGCEMGIP